ncbi:hypothetical protein AB0F92_26195 [Kitasatospora aureofaciens]|uniref:Uncharacterized protein n=1 Tax=Kitasatospora aureofaciens TaxID=1894 RepID=A0A1E7NFH9_KITAU|nr:hypothetical protein [Kitasatospora aureofaciens]OEV39460.1 hypothetical protein HS99_0001810 [Kitasatospora aureofaciens]QEV03370.1 hypothetical protein CP971_32825 [Streptomyces viridifaciens]UKZ10062.1 hypothetical protein BOQ63_039825 [Streptomyces viridifaciens]
MRPSDTGWQHLASAGHPVPAAPEEAPYCADLADGTVLALTGSRLTEPDAHLLRRSSRNCARRTSEATCAG